MQAVAERKINFVINAREGQLTVTLGDCIGGAEGDDTSIDARSLSSVRNMPKTIILL